MRMKRKERYEFFKDSGLPSWVVKDEKDIRYEKCLASFISMLFLFGAYAVDDRSTSIMLICMMIIVHFFGIWA